MVNDLPPKDRDIAMVFQNYALYPHMTVEQNLAFGLQLRKTPKDEIKRRVDEAAKMLGLEQYLKRKPSALSGGRRQRVAMASVTGELGTEIRVIFTIDAPRSSTPASPRQPTGTTTAFRVGPVGGKSLWTARVSARSQVKPGQPIELGVDTRHLHFFDPSTGLSIGHPKATAQLADHGEASRLSQEQSAA